MAWFCCQQIRTLGKSPHHLGSFLATKQRDKTLRAPIWTDPLGGLLACVVLLLSSQLSLRPVDWPVAEVYWPRGGQGSVYWAQLWEGG